MHKKVVNIIENYINFYFYINYLNLSNPCLFQPSFFTPQIQINNKFMKMNEEGYSSQESPTHKPNASLFQQTRPGNVQSYQPSTLQSFQKNLSLTEKQIFSHEIVQQIAEKSKKKTVQHRINEIGKEVCLYATPLEEQKKEYKFDAIPPSNPNYVSTCSQKINQIHYRLSDERNLSQRLIELADKNIKKYQNIRRYRSISDHNIDKRVSLSGLISYNFNSVNARRSLGVIPDDPEDIALAKKVHKMRVKNSCSVDRQVKISQRKPQKHIKKAIEFSNAAVCDFHVPTNKFLKMLQKQKGKKDEIFGNEMQKLMCIKQYMEEQKVGYDEAEFIVNQILKANKKEKQKQIKKKEKPIDDEEILNQRKQILKKKRVMIKHFHFID